jgi:DNA-binding MarR family transcriptional regulator
MQKQKDKTQTSNKAGSVRLGSCGYYFKILGTWMDNKMNERLEPLGLSLTQFAVIMILLEKDSLTQVDIGQKAMLPGYAITRNIDKLESLGYVKRKRHESSRRSYRILLTDAGRDLAPALYRATESVNELFLSPLKEDQKTEFNRTLSMLSSKLKVPT